jgi:hypothetical protein
MGAGEDLHRLGEFRVAGDWPVMRPVGADQLGEDVRVARVALRSAGAVPLAVAGDLQRVDRVDGVAGGDQGLHPRAAVGLDPDHDVSGLGVLAEMVGDQRVQRRDPLHPLR